MRIQFVSHGLHHRLRRLRVDDAERILEDHLYNGARDNRQRHDPQMAAQIAEAADGFHKFHDKRRIVRLPLADGAVDRRADDLRMEHARQRGDFHRHDGGDKTPRRRPDIPP